jgi:hypothetical protein
MYIQICFSVLEQRILSVSVKLLCGETGQRNGHADTVRRMSVRYKQNDSRLRKKSWFRNNETWAARIAAAVNKKQTC